MSIASEITRLQTAKANIKTAIQNKGVTVPSNALLDTYATYIGQISGGGGGLDYETGTYTPATDTARPTISFTNTHTDAPVFISICDVTGTADSADNSNIGMTYTDIWKLFGEGYCYNRTTPTFRYAAIQCMYRGTSSTSLNSTTVHCSYNSSNTKNTNTSYPKYWCTNTEFMPYTNSTGRYWRSGRTYKWIAVWK